MNLEEQYHAAAMLRIAQSDGQRIAELEAERDNAWTELREIRAAISANPEESTLDEVVKLRKQLAERVTELEQQGPRRGVQGIGRGMTYDEWLAQQENACDAVMYGRKVWEGAWSEIEQQLAAKDDEILKLVTSDNKVIVDLSRYVETLEQQIADRDEQISDLTISSDTYFAERNSARDVWRRASKDRDELRQQLTAAQDDASTAWAQAHRLALELECLIMDTKDNAVVSKWWDSAFAALCDYQGLKPGAAEDAEAWAKMRKAGI